MKAIILAGGMGTRLRERVPDLPKPMAPVAGRPFLEFLLDCLIRGGVEEIILSVGYRADSIKQHFGESYCDLGLSYAVEDKPLGTGGAIAHALKNEGHDPVLVLNGDTFLDLDYAAFIDWYLRSPTDVAMVLKEVCDVSRYGSVLVESGCVSGFFEKGGEGAGLINAGVYILNPVVFEDIDIQKNFSFETDLLQKNCNALSPRAFITDAYFIDIGIPSDYDRAQIELPIR